MLVRHLLPSIEARGDLFLSLGGLRAHFFCQIVVLEWIWVWDPWSKKPSCHIPLKHAFIALCWKGFKKYFFMCPIWLPVFILFFTMNQNCRNRALTPFPSSILDELRFEPTIFQSWVKFANHKTGLTPSLEKLTLLTIIKIRTSKMQRNYRKCISSQMWQLVVNFINVIHATFLYERCFGSFSLVTST